MTTKTLTPEVIDAHIAMLNAEIDAETAPVEDQGIGGGLEVQHLGEPTRADLKASFLRAKWARERVEARIARLTEKQEPTKVASAELKTRAKAEVQARKAWDAAKAK